LHLEAVKRIVAAAQREELGCRSYKGASWEAAQRRSGPDKWLLIEEIAEKSSWPIHPFIHPFIRHWFIFSLIHGFTDSLVH
jgi:hypothetical protein